MTDYTLEPEPLHLGGSLQMKVTRGAESWQFFAFVFAAVVTLALTLIDEIPDYLGWWRLAAKVVAFVVIGYLTLRNVTAGEWLIRVLQAFKEEQR